MIWRSIKVRATSESTRRGRGRLMTASRALASKAGFWRPPLCSSPRPRRSTGSEIDVLGDGPEVAAADERGAETGELALASVGKAAVEALGDSQTEDGVADELKLFVVGCRIEEGFRAGFVGERTMGEGEGKQIRTLEVMVPGRGRRLARWNGYGLSAARRHAALLLEVTVLNVGRSERGEMLSMGRGLGSIGVLLCFATGA